jgi:D-glycero-alpha-D-manno-heptose 1-phosphate guanylyltransferase
MTTAIVLAGGLGTRLRGVVSDVPKPMAPILGRPFLALQLDYWIGQGVKRIVLSVGYMADVIRAHFGSSYRGYPVDYAVEATPLGTGGGMLAAMQVAQRVTDASPAPVLVLNGDTFFEVSLEALQRKHQDNAADWSMALFRSNEAGRYMGLTLASDGQVISTRSESRELGVLANGGVYLISPQALTKLNVQDNQVRSLEDDLIPAFQSAGGRMYGVPFDGRFIDIGVPSDYQRAATLLQPFAA